MKTRLACERCNSEPPIGTETNLKCSCGGIFTTKGFMTSTCLQAIYELVEIGEACKRNGMTENQTLWCTCTHSISVRHLLALKDLL